jgi:hypothetical protein
MTCTHRRFSDAAIDSALRAMRLRQITRDHILNKQICERCHTWKVVRERRVALRTV